MKRFQTILALIACFALVIPCVHAEHHHHDDGASDGLCDPVCRGCSHEETCTDTSDVIVSSVSFSDLPVLQRFVLYTLKPIHHLIAEIVPPPGELPRLQTVQLLI